MKPLIPRVIAVLLGVLPVAPAVFAGPLHTKIITEFDNPLTLSIAENVFLQVRNFTQEGGTSRGTVAVTINEQTVNILTASQIISTSVGIAPEVINRVVIAGPATVTVNPVAGATLTITYRKEREGAPLATPAPTATPTPTPTPTP